MEEKDEWMNGRGGGGDYYEECLYFGFRVALPVFLLFLDSREGTSQTATSRCPGNSKPQP